jgi:hypothetical protein
LETEGVLIDKQPHKSNPPVTKRKDRIGVLKLLNPKLYKELPHNAPHFLPPPYAESLRKTFQSASYLYLAEAFIRVGYTKMADSWHTDWV